MISEYDYKRLTTCLLAHKIINKTTIAIKNKDKITLRDAKELELKLLDGIYDTINNGGVNDDDREKVYTHYELSKMTDVTLPKREFNMVFFVNYGEHRTREGMLWTHNKDCLINFVNNIDKIIGVIKYIASDIAPSVRLDYAVWLIRLIERFERIRKFFNFCYGCAYQYATKCVFWRFASSFVKEFISKNENGDNSDILKSFFERLQIECRCPKSIDDLIKLKEEFENDNE